jgi:hypothetical protein
MENRVRTVNDIGAGLAGGANERLVDIRVYEESGSVRVEVETDASGINEVMQYLSPIEAMKFAQAFKRCAIAALEHTA